jgi:hypothetical protein
MGMKEKWEHPDFMPMIKDYFASVRRVLSSLIKNKTFMIINWVLLIAKCSNHNTGLQHI